MEKRTKHVEKKKSIQRQKKTNKLSAPGLPGSPEGAGREGKESLVHTDCACVKLYQDFWYIVYFPYNYFFSKLLAKRLLAKRSWAGDLVMGEATKGEGFSSSLVYALIKIRRVEQLYGSSRKKLVRVEITTI